jgi:hypothetical protein
MPRPPTGRIRAAAVAAAGLVLGALVLAITFLAGHDETRAGLRIESFVAGPGAPVELVVSLEESASNDAARASGAGTVRLERVDAGGRIG